MTKPNRTYLIGAVAVVMIAIVALFYAPGMLARHRIAGHVPDQPAWGDGSDRLAKRIAEEDALARAGTLEGLIGLSRLYHANGRATEALRCYDGLRREQPSNPRWPYRAAYLLAADGDLADARVLLERAVELSPDYAPARLKLAEVGFESGDLIASEAAFREVLEREPDNIYGLSGLARIAIAREAWDEARAPLERVVASSQFAHGVESLEFVYEKLGEISRLEALRNRPAVSGADLAVDDPWMSELVDDVFDPYRLLSESNIAVSRGAKEDATRWLERALFLAPDQGAVHHQAARLWERLRNQVNAKSEYERAVELDPTLDTAWARLVTLYKAIGDTGKARRALADGLAARPDSAALLMERGLQFKERGRLADALKDFAQVAELHPQELAAYVESAQVLFAMERLVDADNWLERSLDVAPENPVALVMLTFSAITRGDRPAADQWLVRVMAQPRVALPDRERLAVGYQQVFGAAPQR